MAVVARRIPAALSWNTVRRASGRLTWGLADQAMASLTNFLLSIYVARTLGAVQFGAFSLAYVTYGLAINASRGLSIEPLLIRFSGTIPPIWRRATARSTGTALLVGLATGTCAIAAGRLVGGTTGLAFVALGLTLPGLTLQDSWRYPFFALGRGHHAFINDTVWAVVMLPAMVFLRMSGHANVFWFVLAWGAGAAAGAAIAPLQAGVMPSLTGATEWLSRHRDLGPRYLVENIGGNASATLRSYSVSYILGLAAVGYIQAANTLMGPLIIFAGISLITTAGSGQAPALLATASACFLRGRQRRAHPASAGVGSGDAGGTAPGLGQLMLGRIGGRPSGGAPAVTLVDHERLRHYRSAPGPARLGGGVPQPACRDPHLGVRCSLWPSSEPNRRHARHDA